MVIVYFDRNVYADICELRRGITSADVVKIENAVKSGSIIIPASHTLFEETVQSILEAEDTYIKNIKIVLNLITNQFMIKHPNQLLKDDCETYANGRNEYNRFIEIPNNLRDILDVSKSKEELITLAKQIKDYFINSSKNITEGLLQAREIGQQREIGRPDNFIELWNGLSEVPIKGLLPRCSREVRLKCQARGIKKMLEIKSLRLYSVYYIGLIHTGCFGVQKEPRKIRAGDLGDFFHAVQSSVAEIFVTQENKEQIGKLPYYLNQINTQNYKILNLQEFLQNIS